MFAALIAPWFVNWNDYRATFEAQAGRILGQPVTVAGSASASILPSPSLTFTDVRVGDTEGRPMMTVDRFEVTIELMPLLQGEIRVVSMKLVKPLVSISVDDAGTVDWLIRSEASEKLDPDKVVLENVEIADGRIAYADARTGIAKSFEKINAEIEARSLYGPWKIDGSYLDEGRRVPFRVSTGRRAESGEIRVKTELSPPGWAVSIAADGDVGANDDGVYYKGTYNFAEASAGEGAPKDEEGANLGWRSEGAFTLTRGRLDIDKAILSQGPPERPYSVAGSLAIDLGPVRQFEATIQARQLDLDRSLGAGPTAPVEPAAAAESLVGWLGTLYVPSIPGKLAFSVPGIIVGGAVIQDASFLAEPEPKTGGWRISNLTANLPGQATLEADGTVTTVEGVGFKGDVHLAVRQPTSFAAWWRGKGQEGAGRQLDPFEVSGSAVVAPGQLAIDNLAARIGAATVRGRFAWTETGKLNRRRHLGTDLSADRIDYTQLHAIAELLVGKDLADTGAIADSYAIKLSTRELALDDLTLRDVAVDASYADDALTVNEFRIGDLGGAGINVTKGRIDKPLEAPQGRLEGRLEAPTDLTGLAAVVARFVPDSPLSRWLTQSAPAMVPAVLNVGIEAPAKDGGPGFHLSVEGVAAATTLSATVDLAGKLADWRAGKATVAATLDSPDASGLARQAGVAVPVSGIGGGGHMVVSADGTPKTGVAVKLSGDFGGLALESAGNLIMAADSDPTYAGSLKLDSDDLAPLLQMAALAVPGAAAGTPLRLDGTIEAVGLDATVAWQGGLVADRQVGGRTSLGWREDGSFEFGGDLSVDEVDLGWLAALGLGFAIEPTGDRFSPWSKAPFGEPDYGAVHGRLAVKTSRFAITDDVAAVGAELAIELDPHRIDVALKSGQALGGALAGGLTINNVGGNANLTGRIDLKGAALDALAWQRAGRAVGTGVLDISANFEAAGHSPAGIVSSLTGGGTLAVRDGEARYINPKAAGLIIRASDLGQEFSDEALKAAFLSYIDGGSLTFKEASAPFAIAAGTIRLKNLVVGSDGLTATGGATIDLNTLDLESDWTLAFDAGDDKAKGTVPQAGIVFRGPLTAPGRIVDVVQLGAYLNIRQEERIQEILNLEQADRAEKERLNRLKRKLREDADRRARDAEAAAAAEAARHEAASAAAATLDAFHAEREALAARRTAAVLVASRAASASRDANDVLAAATAARQAADTAEPAALERVTAARAAARDAAQAVTAASDEEAAAAKIAARAETERAAVAKIADDAEAAAESAEAAATAAEALVEEKATTDELARAAAEKAVADKAAADALAADKDAARVEAEKLASAAVDEDAAAAEAAAASVGPAEDARRAKDTADGEARNAAAARDALQPTVEAAKVEFAAARDAVASAEEALAGARSVAVPDAAGVVDPVAMTAVTDAETALSSAKDRARRAEQASAIAADALAKLTAAAETAAEAVAKAAQSAEAAAAKKVEADQVVIVKAAAREAAEKAAATARQAAEDAAGNAAAAATAVAETAAAADAAARDLAAARSAEEAAGEKAAELAGAAESATSRLAEKASAASEAQAAAALAAAKAKGARKDAEEATAAVATAESDAKAASATAAAAAADEAAARSAADKAAVTARKSAAGLTALDASGAALTPMVIAPTVDPPVRPKRPAKVRGDEPLILLPQIGQ